MNLDYEIAEDAIEDAIANRNLVKQPRDGGLDEALKIILIDKEGACETIVKDKDEFIIEQLKRNNEAFELMSDELKSKAREIGLDFFTEFIGGGLWEQCGVGAFDPRFIYRLNIDYKEKIETEVIKCEIYESASLYFNFNNKQVPLISAPNHPDFIGFLYKDETVTPQPRIYKKRDGVYVWYSTLENLIGYYEVLTPTHVLLKKRK